MKLRTLTLRNFKGIRDLTIDALGNDLQIFADNGVGKTTIADAAFWLLFDKDSQGRKDFEIKTLDPTTGKAFSNLEHQVEAEFVLQDGETVTLRKTYKEDWVKKRGGGETEFSGHKTEYARNGVPVNKTDYDRWIDGVCEEKRFRLLTDPTYFNTVLHWTDRRKMLIDACGDVTDQEVIDGNPKLKDLPGILGKHSQEDYKKILAARRKVLNEEIGKIPVRIDELTRALKAEAPAAVDLAPLRAREQALNEESARIKAGGQIAEKRKQLAELQTKEQQVRGEMAAKSNLAYDNELAAMQKVGADLNKETAHRSMLVTHTDADQGAIASLDEKLDELRAEGRAKLAEAFVPQGIEDTCAACGQPLPAERVAEARQKAEEEFNSRKAEVVRKINEQGKETKGKRDRIAERIEARSTELADVDARIAALTEKKEAHEKEAERLRGIRITDIGEGDVAILQRDQEAIRLEIAALERDADEFIEKVALQLRQVREEITAANSAAAAINERKAHEQRITELGIEQKKLATENERIERELFLCEEFIRSKVSMLTQRINSKFSICRFLLFKDQINGGLEECCETMVEGVPYGSLNHGNRVNAGLDLIETLGQHFGFTPCIFIDNSESVTRILPTTAQQIQLVVSEQDKSLRIETANRQEVAA